MELNKEEKDLVKNAVELCGKILIQTMLETNIPNFIDTKLADDKNGCRYRLKFEKL